MQYSFFLFIFYPHPREEKRETSMSERYIDRLPLYMHQLGIKPTTLCRMGWRSNQVSHLARTAVFPMFTFSRAKFYLVKYINGGKDGSMHNTVEY